MPIQCRWIASLVFIALPAMAQQAEPPHPAPIIQTPSQIKWAGSAGGSRHVTLLGDAAKPGAFITIADWASGPPSRPHYHRKLRTFIVLKGHWDFGWGPKYDLGAMQALPEGSVVTVPAGGIIYDGCKRAPCMVETVGDGDDPEFMVDENGKTISHETPPGAGAR
jgi:quercetin dioxygenase-like cupin family protein